MSRTKAKLRVGGSRICQCSACGEYFSGIRSFDRHRVGEHGKGRKCAGAAALGMTIIENGNNTCWGFPGSYKTERRTLL